MQKLIIKHNLDTANVEIQLEKAINSIKLERENKKELPLLALREKKAQADIFWNRIIDKMLSEIAAILVKSE